MTDKKAGLIASIRKYPPAVFFILGNELCERFSFYGMRAVLLLYLLNEHKFSNSKATVVYHSFVALAYLSPLFGSIAADNCFGRYRVIFWISMVYVTGQAMLSVGSVQYLPSLPKSMMDFSGLVVIALATGGIKPCVSAFAADQFEESQHNERDQFFAFFYLAINLGSFLSMLVTPLLRSQVQCFGSDYCFPLAFGVPGALMLIAFILFVCGSPFYTIIPTDGGNVIFKVFHCIAIALKAKMCALIKRKTPLPHWLDYAQLQYNDSGKKWHLDIAT